MSLVEEASRDASPSRARERREQLATQLPRIVEGLIDELSAESEQQRRRLTVLRRSDIARESHTAIAADVGLSRSQFYRDLHEARELLSDALENRFSPAGVQRDSSDPRFLAIEALRSGGRFDRARALASTLARHADAREAIRALCLRAEVELELGTFAAASSSVEHARRAIPHVVDEGSRRLFAARCDLLECEAAHGGGQPWPEARRNAALEARRRDYRAGDSRAAVILAKALVEEASLRFERADDAALPTIEEALTVVEDARVDDVRLLIDVRVRSSGIRALRAQHTKAALDEAQQIVAFAERSGDVRGLRAGTQMVAGHLLTLDRLEEAKRFALDALYLVDIFGSSLDRVIVLSNLARIDVHRRDGAAALRWIRAARAIPSDAFTIVQALAITEIEALVLLARAPQAMARARGLEPRVRAWSRLTGRLKLAQAVALEALGAANEARRASAEAVEHATAQGSPLLRRRALELDVKLSGNSASRRTLRELQAALSA